MPDWAYITAVMSVLGVGVVGSAYIALVWLDYVFVAANKLRDSLFSLVFGWSRFARWVVWSGLRKEVLYKNRDGREMFVYEIPWDHLMQHIDLEDRLCEQEGETQEPSP